MKTMTTELQLKVAQDELCYTLGEIGLWFERGGCGFVDVWELERVARSLQDQVERLEIELEVDRLIVEVEGRHEASDLVQDMISEAFTRAPAPRSIPCPVPDMTDELDIDVEYDLSA